MNSMTPKWNIHTDTVNEVTAYTAVQIEFLPLIQRYRNIVIYNIVLRYAKCVLDELCNAALRTLPLRRQSSAMTPYLGTHTRR